MCAAFEDGLAANPGQGCKECEIPTERGGRGRGEGMEEEDKAAKDKAWERSQAMALRGRGFRFRGPCPGWPSECSLPALPACQSLPIYTPRWSLKSPPPRPPASPGPVLHFLRLPHPNGSPQLGTHPPAPLYHLWTPPYCCSLPPFFIFTFIPSPDLRRREPAPQPPWDIAPSFPHPPLSGSARAPYAPPWKRPGLSVPAAAERQPGCRVPAFPGRGRGRGRRRERAPTTLRRVGRNPCPAHRCCATRRKPSPSPAPLPVSALERSPRAANEEREGQPGLRSRPEVLVVPGRTR